MQNIVQFPKTVLSTDSSAVGQPTLAMPVELSIAALEQIGGGQLPNGTWAQNQSACLPNGTW